jgi:hypothetical protein
MTKTNKQASLTAETVDLLAQFCCLRIIICKIFSKWPDSVLTLIAQARDFSAQIEML